VDNLRNTLSEDEIIAQAIEGTDHGTLVESSANPGQLLAALEFFYMNGSADGNTGNVESGIGHVYRVHRWLVITDSQGFQDIETYDTESEAEVAFESYEREYIQWCGDDE
jgi:hypothetical protein